MTFTSFDPGEAGCGNYGEGLLHLVDSFTGHPDPTTCYLFAGDGGSPNEPASLPPPAAAGEEVTGWVSSGEWVDTEPIAIGTAGEYIVGATNKDAVTTQIHMPGDDLATSRLSSRREAHDPGFLSPPTA
ncbi:MAG: hypothetical protein LBG06_09580 [Deltaproteobacteria bacterium]|jgi:hypothetical protein|nr:hypothetical protein [Deltaproteobacteria bacterium]